MKDSHRIYILDNYPKAYLGMRILTYAIPVLGLGFMATFTMGSILPVWVGGASFFTAILARILIVMLCFANFKLKHLLFLTIWIALVLGLMGAFPTSTVVQYAGVAVLLATLLFLWVYSLGHEPHPRLESSSEPNRNEATE